MITLVKIAWRNIWRNKWRATILVCAMSMGLVGVLISLGLTRGWHHEMVRYAVKTYEGHIKIMGQGYHDNPVIENNMPPLLSLYDRFKTDHRVESWAERVVVGGLLSTPSHSMTVRIIGIDPVHEERISLIAESVDEGRFLSKDQRLKILVGRRLADKIKKGVGKKVVLMSQQLGGEVGSGAFRVGGIFDTGNGGFDEGTVYILKTEAQELFNLQKNITETVLLLNDIEQSKSFASELENSLQNEPVEVLTWQQRLPFVVETIRLSKKMMIPYYAIFYIAMAFGIVNALLMAIGERTYEIGLMMALGLSRFRLVTLILLESVFIAVVGIVFGVILGWGIVGWLGIHGFDLSAITEATNNLGIGRILYPNLDIPSVALAALVTILVTIIFSIYPASRAARLVPVDAMRRIG